MAEALHARGEPDAALEVLACATARVETNGERWWEAELYRLRAELLLATGKSSKTAEAALAAALAVARKGGRSLELRAAIGLAELWGVNRRREAIAGSARAARPPTSSRPIV